MISATYQVLWMTCEHCVQAVTGELKRLDVGVGPSARRGMELVGRHPSHRPHPRAPRACDNPGVAALVARVRLPARLRRVRVRGWRAAGAA